MESPAQTDDGSQYDMQVPTKWRRLKQLLVHNSWEENRVSGSHYIFVKPGHRCIPLAFHGATLTKRYAKLVLQQAQIIPTNAHVDDLLDDFGEGTAEDVILGSQGSVNKTTDDAQGWAPPIPTHKPLTELKEIENIQLQRQLETQKEGQQKEQARRQELLEQIQDHIRRGEYSSAVSSIDKEGIDSVGNSDEKFQFVSDLIFFKLVSLTEHAFEGCAFNSKEQHDCILETLKQSSRFMEEICDRRQEIRSLALATQGRVVKLYLDVATLAARRYSSGIDSLLQFRKDEVSKTEEFLQAQMHIVLVCLQFIVSMYKLVKEQPFRPDRAMEMLEELNIAIFTTPCIRRMLVLFDMEEFDAARGAADTLLFVAEHFGKGLEISEKIDACFVRSPGARLPINLIIGIANHIRALVPVYRFAKDKMQWSRMAGVVSRCIQNGNADERTVNLQACYERCTCVVGTALTFTDMIIDAIEKSEDYAADLIVSNMTRAFMFDTLLDPIDMLRSSVKDIYQGKNCIWSIVPDFVNDFNNSECGDILEYRYKQGSEKLAEFRKSKYDKLRRDIILMLGRLQKISDIYSTYYGHLDVETCAFVDNKLMYRQFRFEYINIARRDLCEICSVVFDENSIGSLNLYRALATLQRNLDIAQRFHMDLPDKLRGLYQTKEEVLGIGRREFGQNFQATLPRFLKRFVLPAERKRLSVIDRLGSNAIKNAFEERDRGLDCRTCVESTAFALVSQLVQLEGKCTLEEPFVCTFLHKSAARDPASTPKEHRKDIKNVAKRYIKKIEQLAKSAVDQEQLIQKCLKSRKEAVDILMKKFETWVMQWRRLPKSVINRINSDGFSRKEAIDLLSDYVYPWSYQDAEEISRSMLMLQDAGETATSFLHRATSQQFPLVKSVSNSSWTQLECSRSLGIFLGDVGRNAIVEVEFLHDILQRKLANASKTGS